MVTSHFPNSFFLNGNKSTKTDSVIGDKWYKQGLMVTSTIIWTPKWTLKWTRIQWKDTLNYEDGGHYSENVGRKGGQKIQNDTQETKNDTQG